MADIFDYISWRGDLTFEQDGFNELDALVLSRLSYLPFDGAVSSCLFDEITLNRRQCVCLQPMITRKIYCGRVMSTF